MAELTKRFGGMEQVKALADAALLDPRFKNHAFTNDRYPEDAVTRVVGLVAAASSAARPPPPATPSSEEEEDPLVWADFEERVTSLRPGIQNPVTEAALEVRGYLSEHLISRTADPLEW